MRDGDALLLVQLADQRGGVRRGRDTVGAAVDDQARRGAGRQEREVVHVRRRRDADESRDLGAAHQQLHPDPGPEGEARNPAMLGVVVHGLQVVERRSGVGQLADTLVVLALAPAHAAEIEPQHGKAHVVKRVVEVIEDLVVHRAAELGVRVQHDGDGRVLFLLRMVAAFEAAFGSGKNHLGHGQLCPVSC